MVGLMILLTKKIGSRYAVFIDARGILKPLRFSLWSVCLQEVYIFYLLMVANHLLVTEIHLII